MRTRSEITEYVRDTFDMSLRDFITQKSEVELLYDYEIAKLLNVSTGLIGRLRRIYGIKRMVRSLRKFEQTYGKGSIDTFKGVIEQPLSTLADVARHFGFSRENARIVYRKIYGVSYTEVAAKKREAVRKHRERMRQNQSYHARLKSKSMRYVVKAMARAQGLGLSPSIQIHGSSHIVYINGYRIGVRGASKAVQIGRKRYFRVAKRCKDRDFFICVCKDNGNETYYILPDDVMRGTDTYIPVPNDQYASGRNNGERYSEFREAWHLLARNADA